MGSFDSLTLLLLLVLLAVLYALFEYVVAGKHDSREPPLIPQSIPYVGHLLGLIQIGSRYYAKVSARHPLSIYTLGVPWSKLYLVNSPNLVAIVERNSKAVSFAPYVVQFAKRILLASKKAEDTLAQNLSGEDGDWGCRIETTKAMHLAMAPGADLDSMNQVMLENACQLLESLKNRSELEPIDLLSWVRHTITLASTNAVYGPSNPFNDPAVEDGIWTVDKDFAPLIMNVLPSLVARKAHQARQTIFQGFERYFNAEGYKKGSRLVQGRYEANTKYGVPLKDIEQFELGVSIALLVNTAPTTFWALIHIYSNVTLLEELRSRLSAFIVASSDPTNLSITVRHLNITHVMEGCPLLVSLLQEVLRMQSANAAGRIVLKDTLLDGRYLLKKDSVLLIPAAELHTNSAVWGPTVNEFDPKRFMKQGGPKIPASAFRAFGGGTALCPGRFFALTEILSIVAMMVLQYDLKPVGGKWIIPKSQPNILTSVLSPDQDVRVIVVGREGYGDSRWNFTLTGSACRPEPSLL